MTCLADFLIREVISVLAPIRLCGDGRDIVELRWEGCGVLK